MGEDDVDSGINKSHPLECANILQKIRRIFDVDPKIFTPKTKCPTMAFVGSRKSL